MKTEIISEPNTGSNISATIPEYVLHQDHDDEIKNIMKETGCTFRKWDGKAFWTLAKECGHTSLDFAKCACKRN